MAIRTELWSDGSGLATGGPGGWAFVLRALDAATGEVLKEQEGSGGIEQATNQRAEMTAVIEGLLVLNRPTTVTVYSDSEYVVHAFARGWIARWQLNGWVNRDNSPIVNKDLWETLLDACSMHRVEWQHIPGHAFDYLCECGWTAPKPRRGARLKVCGASGCDAKPGVIQRHPHNHRCDKLAGEARKALLEVASVG